MRIITLNTWGGRAGKTLLRGFFERYRETTDVFCLQEVWADTYADLAGVEAGGVALDLSKIWTHGLQEISMMLPDFAPYFRPHFRDHYGLVMFIRRAIPVLAEGDTFVFRERGYIPQDEDIGRHARNLQYATLETPEGPLTVAQIHGLWNGKGKTDTDERIEQSQRMIGVLARLPGPQVLCGDLNLVPESESIAMIERAGFRNLVTEFGVTSTRTSFYTKSVRHADYMFVSPSLFVESFAVLPDEVSDHAALSVEIKNTVST